MRSAIKRLTQLVQPYLNAWSVSRVHRLKSFIGTDGQCFVKREDELGFGITGSKLRKYSALMPYLLKNNFQQALLIGGAYSNNVLGLTQLLIESDIKPILFLLGKENAKRRGNLLLISLLIANNSIHWIERKEWLQVETMAIIYAEKALEKTILIPEGAFMPEVLPGVLTLVVDILQNEKYLQKNFQHIFIDAGTGLTAIVTLLGFAWLNKNIMLHIVLLADDERIFIKKLQEVQCWFEQLIKQTIAWQAITERFKLYRPAQAKSFGAVNTSVLQTIKTIAREEGFLTDPIYSAKLFYTAKNIIAENNLMGNVLIVHSGGGLSLMGFQEQLLKII